MKKDDGSIANLLNLDGDKYMVDEELGLWVKFEVTRVEPTKDDLMELSMR